MPPQNILALLKGGDRRSIGRSNQVVAIVSKNQALFPQLIKGWWSEDRLVRMRAADSTEKVARKIPDLLRPYSGANLDGKRRKTALRRSGAEVHRASCGVGMGYLHYPSLTIRLYRWLVATKFKPNGNLVVVQLESSHLTIAMEAWKPASLKVPRKNLALEGRMNSAAELSF